MLNLYGSTGLGTAGTGVQSGGSMSLQQLLAMMQQGQGGGMAQPSTATPFAQGSANTPMAQYIGAGTGGGAAGGGSGQMMPQGQMPQQQQQQSGMQGLSQGLQSGSQNLMQQIAMLNQMKQGQNGLTAMGSPQSPSTAHQSGQTDAAAQAAVSQAGNGAGMLGWLRNLFAGGAGAGGGAGASSLPALY